MLVSELSCKQTTRLLYFRSYCYPLNVLRKPRSSNDNGY